MAKRYNPIALGISKKSLSEVKRSLKKAGYCGLSTSKQGKFYNIYYSNRCKRKK